jgi:hypothetical protein
VGGAYLDAQLQRLLAKFMIDEKKELMNCWEMKVRQTALSPRSVPESKQLKLIV